VVSSSQGPLESRILTNNITHLFTIVLIGPCLKEHANASSIANAVTDGYRNNLFAIAEVGNFDLEWRLGRLFACWLPVFDDVKAIFRDRRS